MISAPFARVLAAGRGQFNQRVTDARRRFPGFDVAAFADFLQTGVDRVISSVAEVAPERVAPVVLAAYDIALELAGQALAGPKARNPLVNQVWQQLAPQYARLVAEHPMEALGTLTNAAVNLEKIATARPAQWLVEMAALAPLAGSLSDLHKIGQILAWRAGLAHFRTGAIRAGDQLPEAVALAALGANGDAQWSVVRDRLLANPWWTPESAAGRNGSGGMEIGKFTGFGGEFSVPPEVRACPEGFFVKSADRYSFLIADAHGAVLHAATREEFDHATTHAFASVASIKGSRLVFNQVEIDLDLPGDRLAVACNSHTVAVTSPYTHAIRLLPLQ